MKLEILQENLSRGLSLISKAISSKPQLVILGNILLVTDSGRLKLVASNLEVTITAWVGAKILTEGKYTVPAKVFSELVSSLPPGKVELTLNEGQLEIRSGKFNAKINGTPAVEWPEASLARPEDLPARGEVVLSRKNFVWGIDRVAFAASGDESRPVLTGVLLKGQKEELVLVATDGFRLSLAKIADVQLSGGWVEEARGLVVPVKALLEVARVVGESESEKKLTVRVLGNFVLFQLEDLEILARLIEGNFPAFEKIIPADFSGGFSVDREQFTKAVRAAGIFARDSANILRLVVGPTTLKVSANAAQVGENESEVDAHWDADEVNPQSVAFNYRYLLDFLVAAAKVERIKVGISGPLAPGIFRLEKEEDFFLHIIMPVRIQS